MKKRIYILLTILLGLCFGANAAPAFAETTESINSASSSQMISGTQEQSTATEQADAASESSKSANSARASSGNEKKKTELKKSQKELKSDDDATDSTGTLSWGTISNSIGPFNYGTYGSLFAEEDSATALAGLKNVEKMSTIADNYNFGTLPNDLLLGVLWGDNARSDGVASFKSNNFPPLPFFDPGENITKYPATGSDTRNEWEREIKASDTKVTDLSYSKVDQSSGVGAIIKRSGTIEYNAVDLSTYKDVPMKFAFTLTMTPTIFHSVKVHWTATNLSDGPRNVFFLRMFDTALSPNFGDDIHDNVPIYYLGQNQGLYIEDSTHAYKFEVFTDVANGPTGLKASNARGLRYPLIKREQPGKGNQDSTFQSTNDPGIINNNKKEGEIAQKVNTNVIEDTSINMLWNFGTLTEGQKVSMDYDIHVTPTAAKAPTLTVDQEPATIYESGDLAVTGTVKDEDNENEDEVLYYRVNKGEWAYGTTIKNTPKNTANKYAFSIKEGQFNVGDMIDVRVVDIDGNTKMKQFEVVKPAGIEKLEKKVRNVTQGQVDFQQSTTADPGDEIEYQVTLMPGQKTSLMNGQTVITDVFDEDLEPESDVKVEHYAKTGDDKPKTHTLQWHDNKLAYESDDAFNFGFPENKEAKFTYKAKVSEDPKKEQIDNDVTLKSVAITKNETTNQNDTSNAYAKSATPATVNVNNKGSITVKYVDEKGNLLNGTRKNSAGESVPVAGETTYEGKVGDTPAETDGVGLIQPPDLSYFTPSTGDDAGKEQNYTVVQSYSGGEVDSVGDIKDWIQPAVDYGSETDQGNDSKTITFQKEPQTIIYMYHKAYIGIKAPTDWEFGEFTTNPSDKTFYLQTKNNNQAVEVEDYFTTKNWKLSVQQQGQFSSKEGYVLDGAQLRLNHGKIALKNSDLIADNLFADQQNNYTSQVALAPGDSENPGEPVKLMWVDNNKSEKGKYATHGYGTWQYQFGDDKTGNTSIGLFVPKSTKRYEARYQTTLKWMLETTEQ